MRRSRQGITFPIFLRSAAPSEHFLLPTPYNPFSKPSKKMTNSCEQKTVTVNIHRTFLSHFSHPEKLTTVSCNIISCMSFLLCTSGQHWIQRQTGHPRKDAGGNALWLHLQQVYRTPVPCNSTWHQPDKCFKTILSLQYYYYYKKKPQLPLACWLMYF